MNRRTLLQSLLALFGLGAAKAVAIPSEVPTFRGIPVPMTPMLDPRDCVIICCDADVDLLRNRRLAYVIIDAKCSDRVKRVARDCAECVIDIPDTCWLKPR